MTELRAVPLAMLLITACGSDSSTTAPKEFPVSFQVSNALLAPVNVTIDGVLYAILTSGRSTQLTVSSKAQWLTWTSAKPKDAQGRLIPDDISEQRVSVVGISRILEIRNVIGDQTYITASIFNDTSAPAAIGVYEGSGVSCAGLLPARSTTRSGFVQIGYYRLLPVTEVRAYRDPTQCTGPYVAWPASQLAAFAANSGLLVLTLESTP